MELSEFLLARIAEDRDVAYSVHESPCSEFSGDADAYCTCDRPRRVVAEGEAKRRIVEGGRSECSSYGPPGSELRVEDEKIAANLGIKYRPHWPEAYSPYCDGCAAAQSADHELGWVLRLLASVYADHPDYDDPAWKP